MIIGRFLGRVSCTGDPFVTVLHFWPISGPRSKRRALSEVIYSSYNVTHRNICTRKVISVVSHEVWPYDSSSHLDAPDDGPKVKQKSSSIVVGMSLRQGLTRPTRVDNTG